MEEKESHHDRRVRRTKRLLWEALVKLILKKGYEAVTVQDIIDEADVGRSTFYLHFESKEHLLLGSQPDFTHTFFASDKPGEINFQLMFTHAKKNRKVAKAIFGKGGSEVLTGHIKQVLLLKLKDHFGLTRGDTSLAVQWRIEATASGLLSLLSNWIEKDMPLSIEEMVVMSNSLLDWLNGNGKVSD